MPKAMQDAMLKATLNAMLKAMLKTMLQTRQTTCTRQCERQCFWLCSLQCSPHYHFCTVKCPTVLFHAIFANECCIRQFVLTLCTTTWSLSPCCAPQPSDRKSVYLASLKHIWTKLTMIITWRFWIGNIFTSSQHVVLMWKMLKAITCYGNHGQQISLFFGCTCFEAVRRWVADLKTLVL